MINAYSRVINPNASVKLSVIPLGPSRGFAIHAQREIKKNTVINELVGMMPSDECIHSEVSATKVHEGQNQTAGAERLLYGPIRFCNHHCLQYNGEVGVLLKIPTKF